MSELIKRLITAMTLCLTALLVHAQEWTKEDSLRLRKLLDSDQELNFKGGETMRVKVRSV